MLSDGTVLKFGLTGVKQSQSHVQTGRLSGSISVFRGSYPLLSYESASCLSREPVDTLVGLLK